MEKIKETHLPLFVSTSLQINSTYRFNDGDYHSSKLFYCFYIALVDYGILLWYVESGLYHTNTISFFSIVEQDYNIVNVVT